MIKIPKFWQNLSLYKKIFLTFFSFLLIISLSFLIYVYRIMILYEKSQPESYLYDLIQKDGLAINIDEETVAISPYEGKDFNLQTTLQTILASPDLKIQKLTEDTYELVYQNASLATVKLKKTTTTKKLLILAINTYALDDITYHLTNLLETYKIIVPSNYQVIINGNALQKDVLKKENNLFDLGKLANYIEIPKEKEYEINNLFNNPNIQIYDENNKLVSYQLVNNEIAIHKEYPYYKDYNSVKDKLKKELDILSLAENWSLFLTNDLKGETHGFNLISPYLISNTDLYYLARRWSNSIDINWISTHKLKSPIFTNERVENCLFYSEDAFSCEVYLEKNMTVSKRDEVDIMHDRLYFIYYKNGYKLVDIKSIVESE